MSVLWRASIAPRGWAMVTPAGMLGHLPAGTQLLRVFRRGLPREQPLEPLERLGARRDDRHGGRFAVRVEGARILYGER